MLDNALVVIVKRKDCETEKAPGIDRKMSVFVFDKPSVYAENVAPKLRAYILENAEINAELDEIQDFVLVCAKCTGDVVEQTMQQICDMLHSEFGAREQISTKRQSLYRVR